MMFASSNVVSLRSTGKEGPSAEDSRLLRILKKSQGLLQKIGPTNLSVLINKGRVLMGKLSKISEGTKRRLILQLGRLFDQRKLQVTAGAGIIKDASTGVDLLAPVKSAIANLKAYRGQLSTIVTEIQGAYEQALSNNNLASKLLQEEVKTKNHLSRQAKLLQS
jgi:hypothetical protein